MLVQWKPLYVITVNIIIQITYMIKVTRSQFINYLDNACVNHFLIVIYVICFLGPKGIALSGDHYIIVA
jgi:hypothetical protein